MFQEGTLHDIGSRIRQKFQRIIDQDTALVDGASWHEKIADEADRFELWATNLGLFAPGHASLDYRVREAENIKDALRRYLLDLEASLREVFDFCDQGPEDKDSGNCSDNRDDFADDQDGEETPLDLLIDSIQDPINRLYRTSLWIRNPSARFASSKALHHEEIDGETGVDLIKAFEAFDRDFIGSLFYRAVEQISQNTQSQNLSLDNSDRLPGTPIAKGKAKMATDEGLNFTRAKNYLIERLVRANYRHRQQFSYWKRHRAKLALHADTSAPAVLTTKNTDNPDAPEQTSQPSKTNVQSVTTATFLDVKNTGSIKDGISIGTLSIYAPSYRRDDEHAVFPSPPKLGPGQEYFECPYCFILCPSKMRKPEAWRAHLIHDLRPYVCTYENCKTPDQLYDSFRDWIQHEISVHDSDNAVPEIPIRGNVSHDVLRDCPICSSPMKSRDDMHNHLARHLERIALFALPRHTANDEEDEEQDKQSGQADIGVDDSRAGDFTNDGTSGILASEYTVSTPSVDYTYGGSEGNLTKITPYESNIEVVQPYQVEEARSDHSGSRIDHVILDNLKDLQVSDEDEDERTRRRRRRLEIKAKRRRALHPMRSYKGDSSSSDNDPLDDVDSTARRLRRRVRGPGDRSSLVFEDKGISDYKVEVEDPEGGEIPRELDPASIRPVDSFSSTQPLSPYDANDPLPLDGPLSFDTARRR